MMRPLWKAIEFLRRELIFNHLCSWGKQIPTSDLIIFRIICLWHHRRLFRIPFDAATITSNASHLKIFRIRYFWIFTSEIHVSVHYHILAEIAFETLYWVLEEHFRVFCERYISCLVQNVHLISTIFSLEKYTCWIHIMFLFTARIIWKLTPLVHRITFCNNLNVQNSSLFRYTHKPKFFK